PGLDSIIPVSTSTSPSGWSIVQTNTGKRSPSTRSSAARCARITCRLYQRGPARHRPARSAPQPQGYLRPHLGYDGRSMSSRAISGGVVHTVPVDLRRVLIANPKVLAAWEDLTPLARNEWICWVLGPKKAETRSQHIQRLQAELLQGKRRPCCWLGCIHLKDKELSPSVRWVLSSRRKASA